jgi:hypothetical protein
VEKFCVLLASGTKGMTATEAYKAVYGDVKGAEASASRLLSSAKVAARIAAIQQEARAGAVLTLKESLEYLRQVVVTPIGEVDEKSTLCQAAEYSDSGRKIKMPCKLRAIELSATLQGLLREQPEALNLHTENGDIFIVTPARMAELQKRRAAALRAK